MTRISKRIFSWILGALACVALVLGIVVSRPTVNTASAETAVTFNEVVFEDNGDKSGILRFMLKTQGQTWATYHNDKTPKEVPSVANYTTINGRTLTELANAYQGRGGEDILITMQPAGTFSFVRISMPLGVMTYSGVRSVGVLNGWSLTDSADTFTSPTVTFLRNGDTMQFASDYTVTPKLDASSLSISDARLEHRVHTGRSSDSYIVDINLGRSYGEYDAMYGGFAKVRDSIYINGKSIDEWNNHMIEEDARFNDPASYTYFPQNSTDPGHKDYFVKPVGLWGTSTGFRLSIYQELVADLETVEVTVGSGCLKDGDFMVAERVSKTVLTQNVVNITDKLSFLDNTHNAPAGWGPTSLYYINTNDEALWTKAPFGGCLNESDPADAGGGQIQMKYITFNGTDLWTINKNDQGAYGSTQGNIASGGGYAPILVEMSSELGSSLKLTIPTGYTNGKAGHEEIVIKKGFSVKEGDTSYYVSNDIVFTNSASGWKKEVKAIEIETEVTGIITYANRTDGGNNENFVLFQLSNNDYAGLNTTAIADVSSLFGYIEIGENTLNAQPGEPFFNVWGVQNTVAFRAPGLNASQLSQVQSITIKAGAKFPAYTSQNGGPKTYYVTTEDVTFIHSVPNDTWTVGSLADVEYTVNFEVDGEIYHTETVKSGATVTAPAAPEKADDENYTYTFKQWTLNSAAYDFNTAVSGNITLVAEFTATPKTSDLDITNELKFVHQAQQAAGTETYMIHTTNNYWTKAPQGGCLNEYDPESAGGGQEQMKYIYLNDTSLYDINKNDNSSYGSSQGNIANGGIYAPILVMMGTDGGSYSYIQLHVPSGYPDQEATANVNHKSITIKAGFSVTENGTTYVVTRDIKWINLNGTWTTEDNTMSADTVEVQKIYLDGSAKELYKVDFYSEEWNIGLNYYDLMYGSYDAVRKFIFINGKSVYDINKETDDSGYEYSTFPMIGADDATFQHPVLVVTHAQNSGDPHKLTVWIHKTYFETLGENVTLTLGAGFAISGSKPLDANVDCDMTITITVDDGTYTYNKTHVRGTPLNLPDPKKDATATTMYAFEGWYNRETDAEITADTLISEEIYVVAKFDETTINILPTEVKAIVHHLKIGNDTWMIFTLSNTDYLATLNTAPMMGNNPDVASPEAYDELIRIGFLDNIILKGTIEKPSGATVEEATLKDVYNWYGPQQGPLYNIWGQVNTLALRVPVGSGVDSIVVKEGCYFPSYKYTSGTVTVDTRYVVTQEATYRFDESVGAFNKAAAVPVDIQMADGASVRVTSNTETSGLRFQTNVSKASVAELDALIASGKYASYSFGTLIVPTDYLMGGQFTHAWLDANGFSYLDIENDGWALEDKVEGYYTYFGSIVKLKATNYERNFSGIGYVKLVDEKGKETYVYAEYFARNKRSASFVANAAINDRADLADEEYENLTENNNYSPYTADERTFLGNYIKWSGNLLDGLSSDKTSWNTITQGQQKKISLNKALAGPYVHLVYSTNIDVWGKFTFKDGSGTTVSEDFYLQAGTTEHKQYLDVFRKNAVGKAMDISTGLTMGTIMFTNAELENVSGYLKIYGFYSMNKTIDMDNQEIYLTVDQKDGSEITVGAHLGLGGALTYLAKSGIYEGVTASGYRSGNVKISTNTNDFVEERNTNLFGTSKEKGYYGHATSSKPADGAVNLINNVDAGRQIQQSWYAQVGDVGSGSAVNGYQRAYCYTESTAGKYWPYNPVQAGDVVSNPSQIIDYEVNEEKGYIYVKARAMDWAKVYNANKECENAVEGGVTTKSYMENYYRLKSDGTLTVNNSFIDWNGFTDMASCDWASTELPAVYPVHTLNYYVSNLDGDGSWSDGLEYKNDLQSWGGDTALRQGTTIGEKIPYTKAEDWFAWANGGSGSAFAMGVYIPNVTMFTSGRSRTTTAMSESLNRDAKSGNILNEKGLMSNMQPIQYTYQSAYVTNTSYTAPGIGYRMEAYVPIEYSYVVCLGTVDTIRSTFKSIKDSGTVTNAGNGNEKVGLDAWARADKMWTW